ncbi:MAG TPA: type II secretion system protein E [Firmicutes bacterium]|nr:type II secretion system protein E [Bacillota bacterium]
MSKLLEEFNITKRKNEFIEGDYKAFRDKTLLEEFRIKILESLSDKGFANTYIKKEIIDNEIDDATLGYSLSVSERTHLFNLIDGEVNGYGPITELLKDDNITEIMVNSPKDIYIEIDGILRKDESVSFINDEHIIRTIERLIEPEGKSIDINNPMVDARLSNGSRINAIIPPLSKNPIITIRKFRKNIVTMDDLIGNGSLTPYMARFLVAAIESRLNILVSGSSSGGKTSLLNILSNFIPENDRIITIEDVRELNLKQQNIVSLETKMPNYEGKGEITVRDLVRNSLRMRPDRIIIGEVRGSEAFDLLQAMNTGHDGSITTIHANSSEDALNRLETMVLMDGIDLPIRAVREYINNALDIVVHITRMNDGRRKITEISEITGVKDDKIILEKIFEFKNEGIGDNGLVQGEYILNNYIPKCLTKMHNNGINDLDDMFAKPKKSNKKTTKKDK